MSAGRLSLPEQVLQACRARGWTLAVAESCTGGLLGGRLTSVPGSSEVFLGGVIAYANSLKTSLLQVPPGLLESEGAVSRAAAEAMVSGVVRATGAHCGLAVTGIAGPGGGTDEKPVGTVWTAAAVPARTLCRRHTFPGGRDEVREKAVEAALVIFLETAGGDGG